MAHQYASIPGNIRGRRKSTMSAGIFQKSFEDDLSDMGLYQSPYLGHPDNSYDVNSVCHNFRSKFHSFLGVGKNFRLLMQSCCFFSPDLFMKISNFSKTVHTIFTKFCTVILHPKGPLRVQRHQNRMAGM